MIKLMVDFDNKNCYTKMILSNRLKEPYTVCCEHCTLNEASLKLSLKNSLSSFSQSECFNI